MPDVTVLRNDGVEITLRIGDRIVRGAVEKRGGRLLVHWRGLVWAVEAAGPARGKGGSASPAASDLFAPMTGTVVQVFAKDGQSVDAGAPLVSLKPD